MSKEHTAARRVLLIAIQYLPQLRAMSGERPVVTDHINRLRVLGGDKRLSVPPPKLGQ